MAHHLSVTIGLVTIAATQIAMAAVLQNQRPSQASNGVPAALMGKLTRGVNVSRWFCYQRPDDTANFTSYFVDQDFQNLKHMGAHFVRLCVSPGIIYRDGAPDPANLGYVDAGIERLEKAGLAVLWDLHDNGEMKLDAPGKDNTPFVHFWETLAHHYKGKFEKGLVFELLNEPIFQQNPEVWYKLQEQTVEAVRKIDPARTILAASTSWDGVDTLQNMEPLDENNVIYSFHCYDPFMFTHQGATWTGERQKVMRSIPFPSSPEAVEAIIGQIPEQYKVEVRDYGTQRYGAKYLLDRLQMAVKWGSDHSVPVLLGEFGSYPPVAPPDSRARWFDAMHDAIERLGLPNSVWAYDDGFGLGREKTADGQVKIDHLTMEHLYKITN